MVVVTENYAQILKENLKKNHNITDEVITSTQQLQNRIKDIASYTQLLQQSTKKYVIVQKNIKDVLGISQELLDTIQVHVKVREFLQKQKKSEIHEYVQQTQLLSESIIKLKQYNTLASEKAISSCKEVQQELSQILIEWFVKITEKQNKYPLFEVLASYIEKPRIDISFLFQKTINQTSLQKLQQIQKIVREDAHLSQQYIQIRLRVWSSLLKRYNSETQDQFNLETLITSWNQKFKALVAISYAELRLASQIFDDRISRNIVKDLFLNSTQKHMQQGKQIIEQIKKQALHDRFNNNLQLAVCIRDQIRTLKDILGNIQVVTEVAQVYNKCGIDLKEVFQQHDKVISEDSIYRKDEVVSCQVLAITTNTMTFLTAVFDIGTHMLQILSECLSPNQLQIDEELDSQNYLQVIGTQARSLTSLLVVRISEKGQYARDKVISSVFTLNNLYSISIQAQSSLKMVQALGEEWVQQNINDQISKNTEQYYSVAWEPCTKCIVHQGVPTQVSNNAERQYLKDRFASFNSNFEIACKAHDRFLIANAQLKNSLQTQVKKGIIEQYANFYVKFAQLPFTTKPHKYLKYKPQDVEDKIFNLFEKGPVQASGKPYK